MEPAPAPKIAPSIFQLVEDPSRRLHFVGIAGSGMSALAQWRALGGGGTSGSDRDFDRGLRGRERADLEALGVTIVPQDGHAAATADLVIASTAVEASIPDLLRAREVGRPVLHRAELLAHHVGTGPSIAIAGTSGKSTVTAMVFTILAEAGLDPGLITGGDLLRLRRLGRRGNAWRGKGPLVVEADESDGSLVHHEPHVGVVLNLHRDHMETAEARKLFATFLARTRRARVVSDDPDLREFRQGARVFGFGPDATLRGTDLQVHGWTTRFRVGAIEFEIPLPGEHNAFNALAATAAAEAVGVPIAHAAAALRGFEGVARRFNVVGRERGITVVDDFAHNPEKIRAALLAAQSVAGRILAYFQPHGFGPARFLRAAIIETLRTTLRPADAIVFGEIFFAGGTASKGLSSREFAEESMALGLNAGYAATHRDFLLDATARLKEGDLVLLMGARDPALPALAQDVLSSLRNRPL